MSNQGRGAAAQQPRMYWPLAGVVLIYVVLAAIYSAQTPPFEGPDEPQHFAYVLWLAGGKGLPPQGEVSRNTPLEQEAGQTPLYYLVASLPARLIDLAEAPAVYRSNPYFPGPAVDNAFDNDNRAVHETVEQEPPQGEWLALYAARLVTLLCGILLVVGVYLLAAQVWPARPSLATASAALVAFTPQVLFLSSVVSNDIPAAALSTLALVLLASMVRRGPEAAGWTAFAAGLLIGLAAMTKINSLLLGVPVGVTLLWLWLGGKKTFKETAVLGLWLLAGTLLVAGWWFMRGALLYGSPLGLETHDYTSWVVSEPRSLASPLLRWLEVGRYYWITLGWGTIRPDTWIYIIFLLFAIAAAAGLALAVYRWWPARGSGSGSTAAILLVLASAIVTNAIFLEVWMNRVIAPFGRLLFTSIAPITIFLILGWSAMQRRFVLLPLIFTAGLAIVTPFTLLRPAYTPPLLNAAEAQALPPSLGWRFGATAEDPVMELIAVEPARDSVQNDDTLVVKLCWQALEQTAREQVFFLHLIGPQNSRVAGRRSYPGNGLLPSTQWQPGDVFCDDMHLRVDAAWAPTLVYRLEVGVLDEETGKRLTAVDARGNILASTFVDQVRVAAVADGEPVTLDNGGAPIQLVDFELEPGAWQPAESYGYALEWAAAAPLERDYQVFLHLRDSASGAIAAQADHPPVEGWYPTSWWPAGEVVRDEGRITLPTDLPAGTYDLVAGFYDLASLQPLGEAYALGSVEVAP